MWKKVLQMRMILIYYFLSGKMRRIATTKKKLFCRLTVFSLIAGWIVLGCAL